MSTLDDVRSLLAQITTSGSFAVRRTAAPGDLRLDVKGVGRIRLPVTATQALDLCAMGRPARHGHKDQTRLDRRVRDTWEIPKSRISINGRAWNRTLLPALDRIRCDLGLADGRRLKAELYNMLVYEPGQFFATHQDSEKTDDMVATLVVILPSTFTGGAMVIAHHDEKVTFGGARGKLAFVAFYADCHHQVRPITRGYRVALTYNLILERGAGAAAAASPRLVDALAQRVRRFFDTPSPPRWAHDKEREPPDRLVYLLDHQYTQRGLGWHLLKNADAARAAALREVARHLECDIFLALADVHETWSCEDQDFAYGRRDGSRRRWSWHDGDEDEDAGAGACDDSLELIELIASDIELRHWVAPDGTPEAIAAGVDDREVCYTKPSTALEPFQSEHEGYTGNAGNTLDRWYHRAAVVLWPRERTFVIRARASARWAIGEVATAIKAGAQDEARRMAERLRPLWARAAQQESGRGLLDRTMTVAAGLDASELAAMLLQPFMLSQMTQRSGRRLVALLDYGLEWCRILLAHWSSDLRHEPPDARAAWLASTLPDLCRTLCADDSSHGTALAREIVRAQWAWVVHQRKDIERYTAPKAALDALTRLGGPLLGLMGASLTVSHADLHGEMLESLASPDYPVAARTRLLRTAHERYPASARRRLGLASLHAQCVQDLTARLSVPARATDDWSIPGSLHCTCSLCGTLTRFLHAPNETTFEWPLAKDHRAHIHRTVESHDLPVSHTTRRVGRPLTLVLAKTHALFDRDAAERRQWGGDLAWLTKTNEAF